MEASGGYNRNGIWEGRHWKVIKFFKGGDFTKGKFLCAIEGDPQG